jgi:putative phage-type endonuclease
MKTIDLIQGSPEWMAHRAQHFNASDAPAMMGCSPHMTRTELLHRLHTGITPEVDAATQRRFDDGHRFEALARPMAEAIIGEDLYPVTGAKGRLSASFDGLTLMEDTVFEHKSLNKELRATMKDEENSCALPLHYRVQLEQQLLVSGAKIALFMASKWSGNDLVEKRHCWYSSDKELRAQIVSGWDQFAIDLAAYVPIEVIDKPVAQAVEALPAVLVQVSGEISVRDNFPAFEVALRDFLANRLIRKPATDQDFADLDLQIKALKNAEAALDAAESQWLSQVSSIDGMKRVKDMLHKLTRDNRLMAEKVLAARKEEIKAEIVAGGVTALREHITGLVKRLGAGYGLAIPADFAGVIKGKRSIDSLHDAVDTELARAKIAANELADRIDANIKLLSAAGADHLFGDRAALVLKQADDLAAVIAMRLADEAARKEADRLKTLAEEAARVERENAAKVETERVARIRDEQIQDAQLYDGARQFDEAQQAKALAPAAHTGMGVIKVTDGQITRVAPSEFMAPPKVTDTGKRINLTEINARLAPVSITVAGLSDLGFEPVEQVKASRLYRASDLPAICNAISMHVMDVAFTRKASTV